VIVTLTLGVVLAVVVFVALRVLLAKRHLTLEQFALVFVLVFVVAFLAITGRLNPLFALIGAALLIVVRGLFWLVQQMVMTDLARRAGGAVRGGTGAAGDPGTLTEATTRYLHLTRSRDTGVMDGTVRAGRYQGHVLSELALPDLLGLLSECEGDAGSRNALVAYLDHCYPGWRPETNRSRTGAMTPDEAIQVLGLPPSPTRTEIIEAHRRLIQKLHPDRGGSTYLAARINEAKELLLGQQAQ